MKIEEIYQTDLIRLWQIFFCGVLKLYISSFFKEFIQHSSTIFTNSAIIYAHRSRINVTSAVLFFYSESLLSSFCRVCGNDDVGPLRRPVIARCMTGCMTNSFCYSGRQPSRRRGRRTLGKYSKFAYFGLCVLTRLHVCMLIMGAMIPRYILRAIAHNFHTPQIEI